MRKTQAAKVYKEEINRKGMARSGVTRLMFIMILIQQTTEISGQSCSIPDELRPVAGVRWFFRYDMGDMMWLYKYNMNTFAQETESRSGSFGYLCESSFTTAGDFFMIRSNEITKSTRWCEKLRVSPNGQALIRLRAILPAGRPVHPSQCARYIDRQSTKYPPHFLVKYTDDGFAVSDNMCGLMHGEYRARYSLVQGVQHCEDDADSKAIITRTSITLNTCYQGDKHYPIVESTLHCVTTLPGNVVDSDENGDFMLLKNDDTESRSEFYCSRHRVNSTCRFIEMSIHAHDPRRANCAAGGTYSSVGSSSVALLLWHPGDPCQLFNSEKPTAVDLSLATETLSYTVTATDTAVIHDIDMKGRRHALRHVKMVYEYRGPYPEEKLARVLLDKILQFSVAGDHGVISNVTLVPGLAEYCALQLDISGDNLMVDVTEAYLRSHWRQVQLINFIPVDKQQSFKSWEGEELCPESTCKNSGGCVYSVQNEDWFCLCPKEFANPANGYCMMSPEVLSSKLPKNTIALVFFLVLAIAGLVVLSVVLSLVLCRRQKHELLFNSPADEYEEDPFMSIATGHITAFHSKSFTSDLISPDPVIPERRSVCDE